MKNLWKKWAEVVRALLALLERVANCAARFDTLRLLIVGYASYILIG